MANNKKDVGKRALNLSAGIVYLTDNIRVLNAFEAEIEVIVKKPVDKITATALHSDGWRKRSTHSWYYKIPRSYL